MEKVNVKSPALLELFELTLHFITLELNFPLQMGYWSGNFLWLCVFLPQKTLHVMFNLCFGNITTRSKPVRRRGRIFSLSGLCPFGKNI